MKLTNLKPGTILIWDVHITYADKSKRHAYYPCLVTSKHHSNKSLGVFIVVGNTGNWMGSENEHLRLPRPDELDYFAEQIKTLKEKYKL